MQDVRIDDQGRQRCFNCGGFNFTQQRTTRSKVAFGIGALLANQKLRCVRCGEYNDTGSGKPYSGPAGRKYRTEWLSEQSASFVTSPPHEVAPTEPPTPSATAFTPSEKAPLVGIADELSKLANLRDSGVLTEEEFVLEKTKLLARNPRSS